MPSLVARAVALGFDLAAACCDLVGLVAAAHVAAAVAVDFVLAACLYLVVRSFAAAVVALRPVVVDFVPGVALLVVGPRRDLAAYSDPVGCALLCLDLAACSVLVVAVWIVDPAAFALCSYLAVLFAERKSGHRHREPATKPLYCQI